MAAEDAAASRRRLLCHLFCGRWARRGIGLQLPLAKQRRGHVFYRRKTLDLAARMGLGHSERGCAGGQASLP